MSEMMYLTRDIHSNEDFVDIVMEMDINGSDWVYNPIDRSKHRLRDVFKMALAHQIKAVKFVAGSDNKTLWETKYIEIYFHADKNER